jgi:chemotaxis signal transduction protein
MTTATQLSLNQTFLLGATTGTIACLLISVTGRQLLLPEITVVDVLPGDALMPSPAGSADWRLGVVAMRDNSVPVVAFEGLNGQPMPHDYKHIAIIGGISSQRELPYYGIGIQGDPRHVKVRIVELEDLDSAVTGPVEFLQVRYAGELAVIPDLDALEARLLKSQRNPA